MIQAPPLPPEKERVPSWKISVIQYLGNQYLCADRQVEVWNLGDWSLFGIRNLEIGI